MAISDKQLMQIKAIFDEYDTNFLGKTFEYHYSGSGIKKAKKTIYFGKENFMHLCGVESYSDKPDFKAAEQFYDALKSDSINKKQCRISSFINVKLHVLNLLKYVRTTDVKFSQSGQTASIKYDAGIQKKQLFLTFVESGKATELVPYSVIDCSDTRNGVYKAPYIVTKLVIYQNGEELATLINSRKPKNTKKSKQTKKAKKGKSKSI